ncbi:hypothetical protein [Chlorogloea sp. CCALA 695]|uniref:hypothetical protein n=1 Tax=Chlorogloea sp. CCALA 695 TaxID=2107693 RepID=UPI000D06C0D3|nr:hypothetical protein [Chlorogloea sp. CCALA 695]PSB33026.1 hypothetical protein C7B70_08455 [Chlorogloea sp. CCALA 695]
MFVSKIVKRLTLAISSVMLMGIAWLSIPTTLVQASPLTDLANIQIVAVAPKGTITPKTDEVGFDELESGKAAAKIIPKDLGNSNKDIKGRIERAAGELGNDQYQRVFGGVTEDTKLSEAERKVEQKANR